MKILILGGDGYLGWPTAMHLSMLGHEVFIVDNYLRRKITSETDSAPIVDTPRMPERVAKFKEVSGKIIQWREIDCSIFEHLHEVIAEFKPDAIVHYAEQPSAPYSMCGYDEAQLTLSNNIGVTFNLIWAVIKEVPTCHIVKLGTMGEYGTPNIDIEEGWIDIEHKGRSDRFLYPRQAGSLYHTTKVLDTDLLWFYVRLYNLSVTDLMQGPVYGLSTPEVDRDVSLMPNFYYDDIFGTVVNRFLIQAIAGIPLTVYGKGGQTRGYLNLLDTLQCVTLALETPPKSGDLRILNQFTETLSVNEIAQRIKNAAGQIGLDVSIKKIDNPRQEKENHYYKPSYSGLLNLGLKPHFMTEHVLVKMLETLSCYRSNIVKERIMPRVRW